MTTTKQTIMIARPYQQECMDAITKELRDNNQCIATLFCGTGKSFIMKHGEFTQNRKITVYVFYSLALISQFAVDYCESIDNKLIISSDIAELATTDSASICEYLIHHKNNAFILVTYQSFNVLLDCLGTTGLTISLCVFDEAHHITEDNIHPLIFPNLLMNPCIENQVFFTATPINKNKIIMVRDYEDPDTSFGTCGRVVYKYSYLDAVNDGFANSIQIRLEFACSKSTCTIYESIARTILITGNNRVLTFHADVNMGRDTSVIQFVNEPLFQEMFNKVAQSEFPNKMHGYTSVKMVALSADITAVDRRRILNGLDMCKNTEIYIICSCKTIGEGIDTKRANDCVFTDPKSSPIEIIQNMGRVVRKVAGQNNPSTILICSHVDKDEFSSSDDEEKRNETIMRDMKTPGGNFATILNVMAALNQEDPLLFKMCLQYPNKFCPEEIHANLNKQGFDLDDGEEGYDNIQEVVQNMLPFYNGEDDVSSLESESDNSSEITNSEYLSQIVTKYNVAIELHTNSVDLPIERYGDDINNEIIRIYQHMDDDEPAIYYPIKSNNNNKPCMAPKKNKSVSIYSHCTDDVNILWNTVDEMNVSELISNCVVKCEVSLNKYDPTIVANEIIKRSRGRELLGQQKFPRWINKKNRTTAELEQENKDATKLNGWKMSLKGKGTNKCPESVVELLDKELSGWRDDYEANALRSANEIIERSRNRELLGQHKLPRQIQNKNRTTAELEQENKDAVKLGGWKQAFKGKGKSKCPPESVVELLDKELSGWRDDVYSEANALWSANEIIERSRDRELLGQNKLPRKMDKKNRTTAELEQEYKDACKLGDWKMALKGKGSKKCPKSVVVLLDKELSGWRDELDLEANALRSAKKIIERSQGRELLGQNKLPRWIPNKKNRLTVELEQEYKDACKLRNWKQALKGKGNRKSPESVVVELLDKELSGWRDEVDLDANALQFAYEIIERSQGRELLGQNKLPRQIKNKKNRTTAELEQEHKDASKLGTWKQALKGKGDSKCPESVVVLLDNSLSGWRDDVDLIPPSCNKRKSVELLINNSSHEPQNTIDAPFAKKPRQLPEISVLHKQYKTMASQNLNQLLTQNNGQLWHEYHEVAEANDISFNVEDIPRNKIIAKLDKLRSTQTIHIADMGCGKAHILAHFQNNERIKVHSFDHYSDNIEVIQCDIKSVPLADYSVDVVVLSLAMWGSNCVDYLVEASRILKSNGSLYIVEPTRRWSNMDDMGSMYKSIVGEPGQRLLDMLNDAGYHVVYKEVNKFCFCHCLKE